MGLKDRMEQEVFEEKPVSEPDAYTGGTRSGCRLLKKLNVVVPDAGVTDRAIAFNFQR